MVSIGWLGCIQNNWTGRTRVVVVILVGEFEMKWRD